MFFMHFDLSPLIIIITMLVHIVWLWVLLLFLYKLYLYSIFSMFYHVVYNGERNFLFKIILYNKILIC